MQSRTEQMKPATLERLKDETDATKESRCDRHATCLSVMMPFQKQALLQAFRDKRLGITPEIESAAKRSCRIMQTQRRGSIERGKQCVA